MACMLSGCYCTDIEGKELIKTGNKSWKMEHGTLQTYNRRTHSSALFADIALAGALCGRYQATYIRWHCLAPPTGFDPRPRRHLNSQTTIQLTEPSVRVEYNVL